ncbi:7364_t:CDS:1, partial [Gigaspora rosea]
KCDLLKDKIKCLDHVVSQDEIKPDPEKVAKVQEFPTPTSLRHLQEFIKLASYY